ncbi:MAG: transporter [Candidatus Rokuibacteriota bacterium]
METEDTGTLEPGRVEVQLSGDYARNPDGNAGALGSTLSVGLLPGLEARFESSFLVIDADDADAETGIADSRLGVKYRLLDETDTWPAALVAMAVRLPTGDDRRGLGEAGIGVGVLGAISKAFGPITLTGNVAYTFATSDRDMDFWTLASSVEYRMTEAWVLVGELVARLGMARAPNTAVFRTGTVYAVSDRIRLDGAVGVGLTRESPDALVTVGVTFGLY